MLWYAGDPNGAQVIDLAGNPACLKIESNDTHTAKQYSLTDFMVRVKVCPLCARLVAPCRPLFYVNQFFWRILVVECDQCHLVFKTAQITESALAVVYQAGYSNFAQSESQESLATVHPRLSRLGPPNQRRHLDIGCGAGLFVMAAREAGFESYGIDPFLPDINAKLKNWVRKGDIRQSHFRASLGRFELVTLWAVWEHLREPLATVRAALEVLAPGGLLILNCPNGASLHAVLRGSNWYMATLVEHFTFLTPDACEYLTKVAPVRVQRLRHCGAMFPAGTGCSGPDAQGLNSVALSQLFSGIRPDELTGMASKHDLARSRFRARAMSIVRKPIIANLVRKFLTATGVGDHLEVHFRHVG